MDDAIRALERRVLDAGDEPGALLELERACERAGRDLPGAALRVHPRWRTVVWFVDGWFRRPLDDDSGLTSDELDAAEQRVGLRIPRALREAYLLLGRRPDLRLRLKPPSSWELDGGLLVLDSDRIAREEWPYGVRTHELGKLDPPMCSLIDEAAPSVSSFVIGSTLSGALGLLRAHAEHPSPMLREGVVSAPVRGAPRIEALVARLPQLAVTWLGAVPSLRVHASDDVLLLAARSEGIVSARTPDAWVSVVEGLRGVPPG
jgi:hypothetical protein